MQLDEVEVGEPGADEVRIRVQAIGLNRAEAVFRAGQYFEEPQLPARLGYEASGVIEAVPANISGFAVGDQVNTLPGFSMNKYGVYGERAIVPAKSLVHRPAGLSATDAAAVWMQYLTAYGAMVDIAELKSGDSILITAASSSVGLAAIEIANLIGVTPIAVTRTAAKRDALLAAGAKHVIVSQDQDIVAEAMRITNNRGVTLAFDPIAGEFAQTLAATLAPQGILMLYGNLSGQAFATPFPFGLTAVKGLWMRGYLVFEVINDLQRRQRAYDFIAPALQSGKLKPRIAKVFPFEQMVDAHRYLESNQQLGKVVVNVSA